MSAAKEFPQQPHTVSHHITLRDLNCLKKKDIKNSKQQIQKSKIEFTPYIVSKMSLVNKRKFKRKK